jgi:hypothetical protein
MNQPNGPPQGNPQEFYQQYPKISPEMINFGFSAGKDIINRQKDKWMPGVSDFWTSLKIYFAVNTTTESLLLVIINCLMS